VGIRISRKSAACWNNAGAGVTGKILLSTQGWVVAAILSFTLELELIKTQT